MLTWIKTKHMAAGIVSLWVGLAASAASATIITFGSPTNPEGNVSYNNGVLSGGFILDEVIAKDRYNCLGNCQFRFNFSDGTETDNGIKFTSGNFRVSGSEIEVLGFPPNVSGSISEAFVQSVGGGRFSIAFGSAEGVHVERLLTLHAFGSHKDDSYLADFEFSFLGGPLTDGFSTSDITGGEVVIREAGTTTSSGGTVPAPGGLGLFALAGLALMRRRFSM